MGELKLAPKDKRLRHPSLHLHLASLFLLSLSLLPFCLSFSPQAFRRLSLSLLAFCLSFSPQPLRSISLSLLAFCLSFSPGLLLFSLSFSASLFFSAFRRRGLRVCCLRRGGRAARGRDGGMGVRSRLSRGGELQLAPGQTLPARGFAGARKGRRTLWEGGAGRGAGRRGGSVGEAGVKKSLPAGGRQGAVEKFIGGLESASAGAAYLKRRLPSSFVSASATVAVAFLPPLRMMA